MWFTNIAVCIDVFCVCKMFEANYLSLIYSQLYRSSSFNSSGRSSTCDTADDMYSDASLEEDVHDLHHKVSIQSSIPKEKGNRMF